VLVRLLIGRRTARIHPTPALFMLGLYLGATLIAALSTTPVDDGIRAFRLAPLFLSVVLLIGYGGFTRRTLDLLARTMVVVCLVVSAYAALRWAIGTSAKEQALQRSAMDRQYNQLGITSESKVQGSLPNGVLLGVWMACTIPFLTAVAIAWRGTFRMLALAALPMAGIGLLGSAQRAGLAAAIAGLLTVVVAHVLARGPRGPRLGIAVGTVLFLLVSATVVYPAVVDSPERQKRYENLLNPDQDGPFQERLNKWRSAFGEIESESTGHGLGSGNPQTVRHRFADIANQVLDNSYLMIAYEQGIVVAALYVLALLVLLVELLRHAIWTRGPGGSVMAAAGAGALVAMMTEFTANDFVYAPAIVAGWMIVGLGVAQFAMPLRRPATAQRDGSQRAAAPALGP
jgi:hypothetical protein